MLEILDLHDKGGHSTTLEDYLNHIIWADDLILTQESSHNFINPEVN